MDTAKLKIYPTSKAKELGISKRELEILTLTADGHTNQEIAGILSLSYQSVKNSMYRLTKQLQARNVPQALMLALYDGLIKVEDNRPVPIGPDIPTMDTGKAVELLLDMRQPWLRLPKSDTCVAFTMAIKALQGQL